MQTSIRVLTRAALVLALAFGATSSHAALHALGHEFRPTVEQRAGTTPCTATNGVTTSLVFRCNETSPGSGCPNPSLGKLYAEWRTASGDLDAGPILLAEGHYNYRVPHSCSPDGAILVVLDGVQVIDRDGPRGPQTPYCDSGSCWGPFGVSPAAGGFLLVWPEYRKGLVGRRIDPDGVPTGASFLIHPLPSGQIPVVANGLFTPGGDVLLAWRQLDAEATTIRTTVVASDGSIESAIAVSESFYMDVNGGIRLSLEDTGRYLVLWDNESYQDGWVARRVAASDDVPTTSTTTTTLDTDVPVFLPAKEIGTGSIGDDRYWPIAPGLVGDGAGHWFAKWIDSVPSGDWGEPGSSASSSIDDGRNWSAPQPFEVGGYPGFAASSVAADENRVAISAWSRDDAGAVLFRRSTDGGQSWTEPDSLYLNPETPSYDRVSEINDVVVANGSGGRWVVAWTESINQHLSCEDDPDCVDWIDSTALCETRYVLSTDGGLTWSDPRTLIADVCGWERNLQIATDRSGDWLVLWADWRDDGIHAASSNDDAEHWSAPRTLLSDLRFGSPLDNTQRSAFAVAASGDGRWIVAFHQWLPDPPEQWPYTHMRIFVSQADDPSGDWSVPAAVASWHDSLDGRDRFPSIAAGDTGEFALAWSSHSASSGLDADIVASFSSDGGDTWTTPRPVDTQANAETKPDLSPRIVRAGPTWAVVWRAGNAPGERTIRFARTRGNCGNGDLDVTEQCDDANLIEGDGCDSTCLSTGCGSQVVTEGEECDDGNTDETDDCVSCDFAACGDGVVRAGVEECDDANSVDTDACPGNCRLAVCGDGVARSGVEICDDGETSGNNDRCLGNCTIAACGDGYLELGTEGCDDGNLVAGDGCSKHCRLESDCCFLNDNGLRVTATDALKVLKKAIGTAIRCPLRNCDVNRDGKIAASDSLWTLRSAVGLFADGCSWPTTLVLRMASSEKLGALGVELSYADAAGHIVAKPNGTPSCEVLVTSALSSANLIADRGVLRLALVKLAGFQGPLDLLRCDYDAVSGPSLHDFRVTVQDASNVNSEPVEPAPVLTLAAE